MPLLFPTYIVPASPFIPYMLEDVYLKGGFRVVTEETELDSLHFASRKPGMLIWTSATEKLWQLSSDMTIWEEAEFGGGVSAVEDPLQQKVDGTLAIDPNRILPNAENAVPGQVPSLSEDGTIVWVDAKSNAGVRSIVEYEAPTPLATGETHDFELEMGKTCMLLSVRVNAVDIEITAYPTTTRLAANPYTFISSAEFLQDQGIRFNETGEKEYLRRFSFISNLEAAPSITQYFRFKNTGAAPAVPKITVTYLTLE